MGDYLLSCLREKINNRPGVVLRGVGQNGSSREFCGRNQLALKNQQEAYHKELEERALQSQNLQFPNDSRDGERRLVKENHSVAKWAQEFF